MQQQQSSNIGDDITETAQNANNNNNMNNMIAERTRHIQQQHQNLALSSGTAAGAGGTTPIITTFGGLSGPLCILTPCSNSHPFEERRIPVMRTEENAVKIGRSVVRLQPSTNNAIFDCKVLSRNHAILWVTNEGQFLIKDTRSSNGTFINSERLSSSGEESEARELFSGDILQLGVEIVDNTKKVASGCVTCIVRLLNERGEECAGRPQNDQFSFPITNQQQIPLNYTVVRNDKLFILDQYIKEAKFRENVLGEKLQLLESQLAVAQEALQEKWDEYINQELLLSRIELLESQLTFFATKKSNTANATDAENHLRQEIQQLMEDRAKAEQLAKETLREKFDQVQETSMRLHDAEMGLMNVEEVCAFMRQRSADFEDKLNKQREDYDALLSKYNEVCVQLLAAEKASLAPNSSTQPISTSTNQQQKQQQQNMVATSALMNGGNIEECANATAEENVVKNAEEENKPTAAEIPSSSLSNEPTKSQQNAIATDGGFADERRITWVEVPAPNATALAKETTVAAAENEGGLVEKENEESAVTEPVEAPAAPPHQCQEARLAQQLAELNAELQQRRVEHAELLQKYNQMIKMVLNQPGQFEKPVEDNGRGVVPPSSLQEQRPSSAADFQVFILSAIPFLLIFIMLLFPFFHFFGTEWLIGWNRESTEPPTICEEIDKNNNDEKENEEEKEDGA